jgi:hypothetical protein
MKILIACEYSATVRDAFRAKGHDAWSVDLLPTEGDDSYHYQGDVLEVIDFGWDMMIAHPPCTYLAKSGVRWLYEQEGRWKHLIEGAVFFRRFVEADIPKICVENPVPHRYAVQIIGRKYDQIIHPYEHGHGERKTTCLWLKGLPLLVPSNEVEGREERIWKIGPSEDRCKIRSKTYQGIADAMAAQWG